MNKRVLFVDDDPNLLRGLNRQLRKKYDVFTAVSGEDALAMMADQGPFAVVVSDMQMPEMDGAEFLSLAKQQNRDTIRIMLTGDAGQATAIEAVNSGEVFRFATKPCPIENLTPLIDAGIEQFRLITSERSVLTKTLGGSVGVLTELLSLNNPVAFGRTGRIRSLAKRFAPLMPEVEAWEVELAAMLFPIGSMSVPESLLVRAASGESLTNAERDQLDSQAAVASRLINKIPRLKSVAKIVAYQAKAFDGTGSPKDNVSGEAIPVGARILKLLLDFDALTEAGMEESRAVAMLSGKKGQYDPDIIELLRDMIGVDYVIREIQIGQLEDGMLLESNLCTEDGEVLLARGRYVSPVILERLQEFMRSRPVKKTVQIRELRQTTTSMSKEETPVPA
ncbi:HD domain-containing phosphohydrolase [Bremerella cremea]|uniref:HD domain-containing phosphohydrolase n=1 Tax=Bremerella cremea TaxID=1031537 RepID=UPI0031ED17B6